MGGGEDRRGDQVESGGSTKNFGDKKGGLRKTFRV